MEYNIIDVHSHLFCEEDLATYQKKARGRVERSIVIHYKEDFNEKPLPLPIDELLRFTEKHENLSVIGSVTYTKDIGEQVAELEPLLKEGRIIGVKMYPGYEHFYASDGKIVHPVAALCQKYGKPLVFHAGDVLDTEGTAELTYSYDVALHVDKLAEHFPDLKIVISHFNFPKFMECANVVCNRKNVYTDISGTIDAQESPKDLKQLIKQYCLDLKRALSYFPDVRRKVMFGTDYCSERTSLREFVPYIEVTENVFTASERKRVFRETAEEVYFS